MKLLRRNKGSQKARSPLELTLHWDQLPGAITFVDVEGNFWSLKLASQEEGRALQSRVQKAYLELYDLESRT